MSEIHLFICNLTVAKHQTATYKAISTKEVWDVVFINELCNSFGSLVVITTKDHKLCPSVLVNEGTDQSPKDWKDSRSTYDEQTTHCFRIIGLDHLNDSKQCSNTWAPKMTHAQVFEIHDTCTTTRIKKKKRKQTS